MKWIPSRECKRIPHVCSQSGEVRVFEKFDPISVIASTQLQTEDEKDDLWICKAINASEVVKVVVVEIELASIGYKPVRDDRARAHVWQDALRTLLEPLRRVKALEC